MHVDVDFFNAARLVFGVQPINKLPNTLGELICKKSVEDLCGKFKKDFGLEHPNIVALLL